MSRAISIRILEKDNNRRGDLFGRLMSDLFLSLGYDNVRLNIARSGREIDIEAEHRFERRRAIAECKAWDEKVGGKEINAFGGKLRPERRKRPRSPVTPYFISLSGFTETSLDQEAESGADAVILVDGSRVVTELIKGRIVVPLERASERAGRSAGTVEELTLQDEAELLAHERGWIWALYYTRGKERTHVVLVHADGTPLSASAARQLIKADYEVGGTLHNLVCLNPEPIVTADTNAQVNAALGRYYEYLNAECGYILLDGLPADAEVGALRLRLENLFVPLHLRVTGPHDRPSPGPQGLRYPGGRSSGRTLVGRVLARHPRLAILASPGGGKSTLLKRLAVAYADPARRILTDDKLPDCSWLPVFIRCRELRDKARSPFPELLDALAARAFLGEHAATFRACIDRALRDGDALLLVDGLDEVTDAGDRAAFVRNLRTLLAMYPAVSLVVTSREAGFRQVAGLLAAMCFQTSIADFSTNDIRRLTVAWHREVVGNRPDVIADAERLATTICDNNRIRQLAVNPLLLTTLLLVKRWVGQLPTRRTVLYGKAVEVLLMTWNVEAHEPIEQDEALPQLCYIASAMMQNGVQKIGRPVLTHLLTEAREQLSAELAFARIGVAEFIERIEQRSSLLMMSGHEVINGTLTEFYEFRHLTFQEYLTAKALVEGWYANRTESDTLVSLLTPHFRDEKWREVIPLAAVLAGRKADSLVTKLAENASHNMVFVTLGNCLADEVHATPETVRVALQTLVARAGLLSSASFTRFLTVGKYGPLLREELGHEFLARPEHWIAVGDLLGSMIAPRIPSDSSESQEAFIQELELRLTSADVLRRCEGALATRRIRGPSWQPNLIDRLKAALVPLLYLEEPEQLAACRAFGRIGKLQGFRTSSSDTDLMQQLFFLWQESTNRQIRIAALLTLNAFPLYSRDPAPLREPTLIEKLVVRAKDVMQLSSEERIATLIAAYYLRAPWSDGDLIGFTKTLLRVPHAPWARKLRQLLAALEPGDVTQKRLQFDPSM